VSSVVERVARWVRFGAAVLLSAWAPGRARAAAASDQPKIEISIEDALQRAELRSPLIRRAQAERVVVAAQRVGAAVVLPFNPAVSATVGHRQDRSGTTPPSTGLEWSVRAEQTIEIGGQRPARLTEARRALDVAILREQFARVETRARARNAYVGALLAQEQVVFARRREELAGRVLESARARVNAGAASDVELRLAEIEAGRLASQRIEAELAVAEAATDLRLLLELRVAMPVVLTTALGSPTLVEQPLEVFIERARARRADLQALEKTRSQLDAAVVRLRREAIPSPTVFLDVAQQQPGQTYVGAGLGVPIPLWQRNQGPLAVVRAERARNDEEHAVLEREVAVEVSNLFRAVVARAEEAQRWGRDVVPAAEANVDLVSQGWRAGKFDLFRVVQASREAGEARRRQLEILGALWGASIALDRATGTP
jgi:outer membrane protein, heavy metal efflux system